jgi:FkbM family methyltransferase
MESSEDFVTLVYQIAFRRNPDPEGLKHGIRQLKWGMTPLEFLRNIKASEEFNAASRWDRLASSGAEIIMPLKNGGKLCGSAKDTFFFQDIVNLGGIIKPHVTQAIQEYLMEGDTFIDAGAHIGYFTILASHIVGSDGKVLCFELFPANFEYLQRNIKLNNLGNVTAYHCGLWDSSTKKGILETAPNIARIVKGNDIEMMAFDSLDVKPNLIRMNIEGSEPFALHGMTQTLERYRPVLLLEFNPVAIVVAGGKITDFWRQLEGYKIYKIPGKEAMRSFEQLRRICPDHSVVDLLALP